MEEKTDLTAMMTVPVRCIICKEETMIELDGIKFFDWRNGRGSIQKCLPELTDIEREFLVTGLCQKHQPDGD